MAQSTCWKLLCTVLGILEAAVYSVTVFGWPAFVFIFVEEGFYGDRCYFDSVTNSSDCNGLPTSNCTQEAAEDARVHKCTEQEEALTLVYTIAVIGVVSLPVLGYIYDHCGTVCVRIVCICLCAGGFFLMALAERGTEWLLFPGAVFQVLGGLQLAVTDVQVAGLFPKAQATLTCLVSGAMGISAFVPVLLKLTYQAGVSYKTCMFTFTGIILLVSSVNTITLPPRRDDEGKNIDIACCLKKHKGYSSTGKSPTSCKESSTNVHSQNIQADGDGFVSNDEVNELHINRQGFPSAAITPDDTNKLSKTEPAHDVDNNTWQQHKNDVNPVQSCEDRRMHLVPNVENAEDDKGTNTSLLQGSVLILKSPSFWVLMLWFLCQETLMVTYLGSFYSVINYYGNNVKSTVSTYTDAFSWLQMGSLFWAFLTGLMLDKLLSRATKDDKEQCFMVPFALTVLAAIVVSIACIIPIIEMQFVAILFHSLLKTGSYAVHLAFITTAFPKEHIGKTFGIQVSVGNLLTFVQFPIFSWYKNSLESDPLWLGVLFLGMCFIASCLPFYLLWRRCRSTRSDSYKL